MNLINLQQIEFLTGATELKQCPADQGYEVAFVGRSNAGKSSAINTLCNRHSLARTSKTPGRTQQINFFRIDEQRRLVDLPGYGYAKVAHAKQERWQETIDSYLRCRQTLSGVFLIMDARHPLKDFDQNFIAWSRTCELRLHILLTKADKLSRNQGQQTLFSVTKHLENYPQASVQLFSALNKQGLEQALEVLGIFLA